MDSISCDFCIECAQQFFEAHRSSSKESAGTKNAVVCAAQWHVGSPVPSALEARTYTERRIIALARVYVSIKRVHPEGAAYVRDSNNFQPLYHEHNVIAYLQTQEYV